jgi:hypothetical protein
MSVVCESDFRQFTNNLLLAGCLYAEDPLEAADLLSISIDPLPTLPFPLYTGHYGQPLDTFN